MAALPLSAEPDNGSHSSCPVVKVEAERLPDLNTPRSGHAAFILNGELTVFGGHTAGFVLTPTLAWVQVPVGYCA